MLVLAALMALGSPELLSTGEPARTFHQLEQRLARAEGDGAALGQGLEDLFRVVAMASLTRVDAFGPGFDVPVRSGQLFGETPRLPTNRAVVRLELASERLFVFGVTVTASRAIRLDRVRLHFQDGSHRDHRFAAGLVLGAGKASSLLQCWSGIRRALVLEAIEFEGQTLEEGSAAELSLSFQIPDPASRPYRRALQSLEEMRARWPDLGSDVTGMTLRREDLNRLRPLLFPGTIR